MLQDEVPNWLRSCIGLERKSKVQESAIPDELQEIAVNLLLQQQRAGAEISTAAVESLLSELVELYNKEVSRVHENFDEQLLQEVDQLQGVTDIQAFMDERRKQSGLPEAVLFRPSQRALNQIALAFNKKYGFSLQSNTKPMMHLPRGHPAIQEVIQHVHYLVKEKKVHPRLIMNFDQVWTTLYEPIRKVLKKDVATPTGKDPLAAMPQRQQVRARVQEYMGQAVLLPKSERSKVWQAKLADLAGASSPQLVQAWRSWVELTWAGVEGV